MMKTKRWQEFRRFIEAQQNILSQNELVITTINKVLFSALETVPKKLQATHSWEIVSKKSLT